MAACRDAQISLMSDGSMARTAESAGGISGILHHLFHSTVVISAATSFVLYINPGTGHDVNTQPSGLQNIWPFSHALGMSPLNRPDITSFITLLPKVPAPCCLGRYLDVTSMSAAGGLPGRSLLNASMQKSLGSQGSDHRNW